MTGKKSFWMLFTILMVSFAFLIFIGGTEPDSSIVNPAGNGENPDVELVELPEGDKPLHVAVSLSSSEFRVMQTLSEQFGKQHAHVVVHLENTPASEWNDRLEHSLYQREATDILLLDNVRIGEFASAGLLLPLDDVFKQDERGGYLPQVLDQAKWNGYVWAVPKEVDPYVFVLNPDALREAGLSGMPGTTEEIVNWSRILQNRYGIGVYVNPDDPLAISSLYAVMGDDLDRLFSSPEDHAGIPGDEALANEGSRKTGRKFRRRARKCRLPEKKQEAYRPTIFRRWTTPGGKSTKAVSP